MAENDLTVVEKPPDAAIPDTTDQFPSVRAAYIARKRAEMANAVLTERNALDELKQTVRYAESWAVGDDVPFHYDDVKLESEYAAALAGYLSAARRTVLESGVAACDVCGIRPGSHTTVVSGLETWVCGQC